MKTVTLVTDGSCLGNPGPGGWAAIVRFGDYEKELCGSEAQTTNNRMEMTAVIKGLSLLKEPCQVRIEIDSKYVENGITKWMNAWQRRGWKTASKQPVRNKDLWQDLNAAVSRHQVQWAWVKGHAWHAGNNRCDELARRAALERSTNRL